MLLWSVQGLFSKTQTEGCVLNQRGQTSALTCFPVLETGFDLPLMGHLASEECVFSCKKA